MNKFVVLTPHPTTEPGQGVPGTFTGVAALLGQSNLIQGRGPSILFYDGSGATAEMVSGLAASLNQDFLSLFNNGVSHARLTTSQRDAIINPPDGLEVWNITTGELECYSTAHGWFAVGAGVGGGVTTVGTIDTQGPSADGQSIVGNSIFAQSASASVPGLVNLTTQTFAGAKLFSTSIASPLLKLTNSGRAVSVQAPAGMTGDWSLTVPNSPGFSGNVLSTDGLGVTSWVSPPDVKSFAIWQTDHGTFPTASSATDVMDVTSSDGSITVTGNAPGKFINLQVANPFVPANLGTSTAGVSVTGGTGAVSGSGTLINIQTASGSQPGLLSSTDWNTFNNKQSALAFGNLTDVGTDGITITGGAGAVVGSGTSISQHVADASHNGYLSSTDWSTFNAKFVNPMTTQGDLIYGGTSGAGTRLAGDTSNARKFLRTQSSAGVAQPPVWDGIQASDLPTIALTGQVTGSASGGSVATTIPALNFTTMPVTNFQDGQDPTQGYSLYEEWDVAATTGRLGWTKTLVGTGTDSIGGDTNHPGIQQMKVSANADAIVLNLSAAAVQLGGGVFTYQCNVRFPTLSGVLNAGADTYLAHIGLSSQGASTTDGVNLIWFQYDQVNNGNFFEICCRAGGAKQTTVTSQAIVANTWYTLKFVVNAAASSVQFFVNGTSVGTLSTQVPASLSLNGHMMLLKNGGSAQVSFENDYVLSRQTFTSAR